MKIFLIIFIFCLTFNKIQSIETKIIHRIQNAIVTNIDIKNQFKYLIAINNSLKELDKESILKIASNSIIKERIKEIELSKNFEEIELDNEYLNTLLKKTYLRLGLKSLGEFEIYLKDYDLTIKDVERKLTIDALWNELILQKYGPQVSINEELIKEEISNKTKMQSIEYEFSEIIFDIENKNEIDKKYEEILKSIKEIGFKNSASKYSFSESAKIGGTIGWINENSLSKKIKKSIAKLKVNEVSKPIILSNGILILKIMNTRVSEVVIDVESEFKKMTNYERNRQLSQYSKIYYNKIKKNLEFDG